MVGLRVAGMRFRPAEFLDFTSLTVEEFQVLIPPFEAAFQAHMAMWCLDGTPRTARRFSVYQTLPAGDAGRSAVLPAHVSEDLHPPGGPRTPVRDGTEQGQSVDPCAAAGVARGAA